MKDRKKIYFIVLAGICMAVVIKYLISIQKTMLVNGEESFVRAGEWSELIAESVNNSKITFLVDGNEISIQDKDIFLDDDLIPQINMRVISQPLLCAVNFYPDGRFLIEKGKKRIELSITNRVALVDGKAEQVSKSVTVIDGNPYVSVEILQSFLNYRYDWNPHDNAVVLVNENPDERIYPYIYDYRELGKVPPIKDQSIYGTCWAFSALTALESSLLPDKMYDFSEDHMTHHNGYTDNLQNGGYINLASAYLTAWRGPVYEKDDPYGDGVSPDNLAPVVHVQEVQIIPNKNLEEIKKAVFLYGGVQTALYVSATAGLNKFSDSYNPDNASYCYIGTEKPNHAVTIIGWDDAYPAQNFSSQPMGDGAFICSNSWGEEFGENGYFYVSYYDTNIGTNNVVYTVIEKTDNYDNIYQSDIGGFTGQLGYRRESAYFANVYEVKTSESLKAVGFYSLAPDTQYQVYLVKNFDGKEAFNDKLLIKKGYLKNAGYYTVKLDEEYALEAGRKCAVVVYITSPNEDMPIAIECARDDDSANFVLGDGEGYISYNGKQWEHTEEKYNCNICLKMYTGNETDEIPNDEQEEQK